jgi:hypothetical protein
MEQKFNLRSITVHLAFHTVALLLIIHFIEPILSFVSHSALGLMSYISQSYLDRLYAESATGEPAYAYYIFIAPFFLASLGCIEFTSRIIKKTGGILKPEKTREIVNVEAKAKSLEVLRAQIVFLAVTLNLVILLLTTGLAVDGFVRLKIISTFKQHVTILEGYLPDADTKLLKAQFASMRSQGDYDAICDSINRLATQHSITLPKNKLYSFF